MSHSPFVHGGPVKPADFLNRRRELRRLLNRLEKGQATAVVGQPHTGKTSLLRYVMDKVKRDSIDRRQAGTLLVPGYRFAHAGKNI